MSPVEKAGSEAAQALNLQFLSCRRKEFYVNEDIHGWQQYSF